MLVLFVRIFPLFFKDEKQFFRFHDFIDMLERQTKQRLSGYEHEAEIDRACKYLERGQRERFKELFAGIIEPFDIGFESIDIGLHRAEGRSGCLLRDSLSPCMGLRAIMAIRVEVPYLANKNQVMARMPIHAKNEIPIVQKIRV